MASLLNSFIGIAVQKISAINAHNQVICHMNYINSNKKESPLGRTSVKKVALKFFALFTGKHVC